MTTPNVDNTTLNNLIPNLDIGDVADPVLRLLAFQYIYTQMQDMVEWTEVFMGEGQIDTVNLADLAVTTAKLAALGVTSDKLANSAVITSKLQDLAVITEKIASLAVTTEKLANSSITTEKLANNSVTHEKIPDGTLTLSEVNLPSFDSRYYTETETDAKLALKANSADVYTKEELTPFLQGGDTSIKYEVYFIVTSDNEDGTFTYKDVNNVTTIGALSPEGYQIFTLKKGVYTVGLNRIEIIINDTLLRSAASGGLVELSTISVALTDPESAGTEITIKYYERIGLTGEHGVIIGPDKPLKSDGNMLWLKITG